MLVSCDCRAWNSLSNWTYIINTFFAFRERFIINNMGLLCVLLVWLRTRKDEKSPAKIVFPSHQNDPLPGRIKVDFVIPKELPFGDKDTKSKVTLLEGDHVRFNISTDRRDKLERATNIEVLSNTFQFTNEAREMVSVITSVIQLCVHYSITVIILHQQFLGVNKIPYLAVTFFIIFLTIFT